MMLGEVVFMTALVVFCYITFITSQNMVGKGSWMVISLEKCQEDNMFKFKFDVTRRKMNRTHDGFTAKLKLAETIDSSYGVRIDICKDAEGGCKPYQTMTDDSFAGFINKYAEQNVRTALELGGIDPPEFPVAKGEYVIVDYIFDYSELPEDGPYGVFGTQAYLIKNMQEVGCITTLLEFKELEEADDEEDEE